MENDLRPRGTSVPSEPPGNDPVPAGELGPGALERLASFRFTYVALFSFIALYVFSVEGAEMLLQRVFESRIEAAVVSVEGEDDAVEAVRSRVAEELERSWWIDPGGLRITPLVVAADGRTLLYAGGPSAELPLGTLEEPDPTWLFPATVTVVLTIPHGSLVANAVLLFYFALLVSVLMVQTRRLARQEEARIAEVLRARNQLSARARSIEQELEAVRGRLAKVEPEHESHAGEIAGLQRERRELLGRLERLELREAQLREGSERAQTLEEERRTLEELLDEALGDLSQKEEEIRGLERQVKKAERRPAARARESEQLGRRLRTLYKNLEIDERALSDLAALGDESQKLKAEEALKRLTDAGEQAAVRRKVGGLPPYLSIFELGFGRGGRIYYTRVQGRSYRVLLIGGKNSQKPDLEYLSRLPRGT